MAKQGIDLKAEMAKKLKEVEEHFLKEKVIHAQWNKP